MEAARLLHALIPPHSYLPDPGYNITFTPLRGFHRTLSLSRPSFSPGPPPYPPPSSHQSDTEHCIFQALLFLPPHIFADPYELQQRHADGRLGGFKLWGEVDLEGPVSAVDGAGTVVLLEIGRRGEGEEVPLHLRYPRPKGVEEKDGEGEDGQAAFELPCPVVYWACGSASPEDASPFDRLPPPFVSPYAKDTAFHFLRVWAFEGGHSAGPTTLEVLVPRGDLAHLPLVEWGTTLAVLFAFLYVSYSAWTVPPRSQSRQKIE